MGLNGYWFPNKNVLIVDFKINKTLSSIKATIIINQLPKDTNDFELWKFFSELWG